MQLAQMLLLLALYSIQIKIVTRYYYNQLFKQPITCHVYTNHMSYTKHSHESQWSMNTKHIYS